MKLRSSTRFERFLDLPLELRCLVYHHYAAMIPQAPVHGVDEELRPEGFTIWRRAEEKKRAAQPPPLTFANKQTSLEFKDQIKYMAHRSLFAHIIDVSNGESLGKIQTFQLPAKDFKVENVYVTFDDFPTELDDDVEAIESHILKLFESAKELLKLCHGVKTFHCYYRGVKQFPFYIYRQSLRGLKVSSSRAGTAPLDFGFAENYTRNGYNSLYGMKWKLSNAGAVRGIVGEA